MVVVYAIVLLGLSILTGFNGQISLGHGAFFAIGAYTTAILLDKTGIPYWATVPIAGVVCLVAGFLFGLPALAPGRALSRAGDLRPGRSDAAAPEIPRARALDRRRAGHHLRQARSAAASADQRRPVALFLLPDRRRAALRHRLEPLARAHRPRLVAIRDHAMASAAMGIDTAFYKSATFGVSAMYTGIAGALGALVTQFVAPDSFPVFLSISFLVGIVVGGIASIPGAVFGAVFIEFVPNLADADLRCRALGGLWRLPDRLHLCHAAGRRRAPPHARRLPPQAAGAAAQGRVRPPLELDRLKSNHPVVVPAKAETAGKAIQSETIAP